MHEMIISFLTAHFDIIFPVFVTITTTVVIGGWRLLIKILRTVKWIGYSQGAMDYGIEHAFNEMEATKDGNGGIYKSHKDKKLKEYLGRDNYISTKSNPLEL